MINSQRHRDGLQLQLLQDAIPFLKALRGRLATEVAAVGESVSRPESGWDFDPVETLTELEELIQKIEDALREQEREPTQQLTPEQLMVLVYRILMILDVILTLSDKLPL